MTIRSAYVGGPFYANAYVLAQNICKLHVCSNAGQLGPLLFLLLEKPYRLYASETARRDGEPESALAAMGIQPALYPLWWIK